MDTNEIAKQFEDTTRATKIVSNNEWKKAYKKRVQEELTLSERFQRAAVIMPLSVIYGFSSAFNSHVRYAIENGYYERRSPKPSERKESFLNGMVIAEMTAFMSGKPMVLKQLDAKINELALQAFDECKDYTPEFKSGVLRRKY